MNESHLPLNDLLVRALRAALLAGDAIRDVYNSDFAVSFKNDSSPLTEADRRAHQAISSTLPPAGADLPDIPLLSEEGRDIPHEVRKDWDLYWLVDPLDGTREFIKRNGQFTVNIALIQRGRPVLGVVYVPVGDTLYLGGEGLGAFVHEAQTVVEMRQALELGNPSAVHGIALHAGRCLPQAHRAHHDSGVRLVQSASHGSGEEEALIARLSAHWSDIQVISAGSSLKFCRVAEGDAHLYPRFGPTMEWDTAAGQCIVEQAGGEVLDVRRHGPLRYNKESLRNGPFIATGHSIRADDRSRSLLLDALP